MKIANINSDARMVIATSDHWIEDTQSFQENMLFALEQSDDTRLITFGITPTFPATGYGYIALDDQDKQRLMQVKHFNEKLDYTTAIGFLDSKKYPWNAGIFVWHAKAFLNGIEQHQPAFFELFNSGISLYNTSDEVGFVNENYPKAEDISIDYALLEKSASVNVIRATFDWNDLGSWKSLYDQLPKEHDSNAIVDAEVFIENSSNN